jgi:hypothetical protein
VGNSLASHTAVKELPSLGQFLTVGTTGEELSLLKGEFGSQVADLKAVAIVSFFCPAMLASASLRIKEVTEEAHAILFKQIKTVRNHFGKVIEQIPNIWTRTFERLWVIGNDWTNVVKVHRPSRFFLNSGKCSIWSHLESGGFPGSEINPSNKTTARYTTTVVKRDDNGDRRADEESAKWRSEPRRRADPFSAASSKAAFRC